jgi:hypothetical protein
MKSKRRTEQSSWARISLPRIALLALSLFAFVLQSWVTETHIHFGDDAALFAPSGQIARIASLGDQIPLQIGSHKERPAKHDPASCPFCQATVQSGAFLIPAALLPAGPQFGIQIAPIVAVKPSVVEAVSHDWRGRAPPAL